MQQWLSLCFRLPSSPGGQYRQRLGQTDQKVVVVDEVSSYPPASENDPSTTQGRIHNLLLRLKTTKLPTKHGHHPGCRQARHGNGLGSHHQPLESAPDVRSMLGRRDHLCPRYNCSFRASIKVSVVHIHDDRVKVVIVLNVVEIGAQRLLHYDGYQFCCLVLLLRKWLRE